MVIRTVVLASIVFAGLGCGKKAEPAAEAPPAPAAAPPAEPAAEAPTEPAEDDPMAQLKAKQDAAGGPINWKQLGPFLPDQIGDFKASRDLEGSTHDMGNGAKLTQAQRGYKADGRTMSITIAEAAIAPVTGILKNKMKVDNDSSDGFTKTIEVDGHPALLTWTKGSAESDLQVLAGERVVDILIRKATTPEEAETIAKLFKIDDLAKLKAEPAK